MADDDKKQLQKSDRDTNEPLVYVEPEELKVWDAETKRLFEETIARVKGKGIPTDTFIYPSNMTIGVVQKFIFYWNTGRFIDDITHQRKNTYVAFRGVSMGLVYENNYIDDGIPFSIQLPFKSFDMMLRRDAGFDIQDYYEHKTLVHFIKHKKNRYELKFIGLVRVKDVEMKKVSMYKQIFIADKYRPFQEKRITNTQMTDERGVKRDD